MSATALLGWACALAATAAATWAWLRLHARMELVARAAHELRSPLCAARLAVHAAAREGGWPALAPVDRELARAGLALEDLGAARGGARVEDRAERLDVGDLLDEVRQTWAPLAWPVRREVRVEPTHDGFAVRIDRLRAAQALGNLVGNALEHGSGPVVLRARDAGDRVRLEVEDRGAGLPAPLSDLTRRPRGGRGPRGRGLAIADGIARRHGGTLHHERTTGGCRLVLELPAADAPALRSRPPVSRAGDVDLLSALRLGGTARPAPSRGRRVPGAAR
jgi:signal transduction histidine kinase